MPDIIIPGEQPVVEETKAIVIPGEQTLDAAAIPGEQVIPGEIPGEEKPATSGFFAKYGKNIAKNEWVKDEEIKAIAKKRNISPDILRTMLDFNLAARELSPEEANVPGYLKGLARRVGGVVNVSTGGVIEKVIKQASMDDNTQRAIDEVEALGEERKDYLQRTGEMVLPGFTLFGKATGAAAKSAIAAEGFLAKSAAYGKLAATAAPTGMAYGYGGSKTGEEVGSTLLGGALAGGIVAGIPGAVDLGMGTANMAKDAAKWAKTKALAMKAGEKVEAAQDEAGMLLSSKQRISNLEEELSRAEPGSKEYEDLSIEIDSLKTSGEFSDDMKIPERKMGTEDLAPSKYTPEMEAEYPNNVLPAHTWYDTSVHAHKEYDKNAKIEAEIYSAIEQSINKTDADNPFIPSRTGKAILMRFQSEQKADETFDRMTQKLLNSGKYATELEAEEVAAKLLLDKEKLRLAKHVDPTANKKNFEEVLQKHMSGMGTGPEGLKSAQERIAISAYGQDYLKSMRPDYAGKKFGLNVEDKILLPHAVFTEIDSKAGGQLAGHLGDLMNNLDGLGHETYDIKKHAATVLSDIKTVGTTEDIGRVLAQLSDMGKTGRDKMLAAGLIGKEEHEASNKLSGLLTDIGMILKQRGLALQMRKAADGSISYFPVVSKDAKEIQRVLGTEYNELKDALRVRDFDFYRDFEPPSPEALQKLSPEQYEATVARLKEGREKVQDAIDKMSDVELSQLNRERQLVKSLAIASHSPIGNKKNIEEAIIKVLDDSDTAVSHINTARATMQRTGEVPELIREYNIEKAVTRYVDDGFRYLAMKEPLAKIDLEVENLKTIGAGEAVQYITKWKENLISGREQSMMRQILDNAKESYTPQILALQRERENLIKNVMENKPSKLSPIKYYRYLREHEPRLKEIDKQLQTIRFKQEAPEVTLGLMRNIFMAKIMGGKVKQGIRDLWQPYTMGAHEIGGGGLYGSEIMTKATADYILKPRSYAEMKQELIERGHMSNEFAGQVSASRESTDMYNEWLRFGEDKAKKMTQYFMIFRQMAETVNRTTMLNAAKHISADFMHPLGNAKAQKYIENRLSPAYQARVRIAQSRGTLTQEQLTSWIADDLINKTQFRYHPAMKSELARDLGPMFSQFTQYSSGVASAFSMEFRRHGAGSALRKGIPAVAWKAIGPAIGLAAVSKVYDLAKGDTDLSPREEVFLYKAGAMSQTPLLSAFSGLIPGAGPELDTYRRMAKLFDKAEISESYGQKWIDMGQRIGDSWNPIGAPKNLVRDIDQLILNKDLSDINTYKATKEAGKKVIRQTGRALKKADKKLGEVTQADKVERP